MNNPGSGSIHKSCRQIQIQRAFNIYCRHLLPSGLSVDSVPCKNAWAKELGIADTKLLSDFWQHGEVARSYGLFREEQGFSQRAKVILDENGQVVYVKTYDIPVLPDIEDIIQFLRV